MLAARCSLAIRGRPLPRVCSSLVLPSTDNTNPSRWRRTAPSSRRRSSRPTPTASDSSAAGIAPMSKSRTCESPSTTLQQGPRKDDDADYGRRCSSLTDYIQIRNPVYLPHTAGRYAAKQFRKAQMPIVERLVNSLMRTAANNGALAHRGSRRAGSDDERMQARSSSPSASSPTRSRSSTSSPTKTRSRSWSTPSSTPAPAKIPPASAPRVPSADRPSMSLPCGGSTRPSPSSPPAPASRLSATSSASPSSFSHRQSETHYFDQVSRGMPLR